MTNWMLVFALLMTLGCGSTYGTIPRNNIVMVNTEGHPVDPTGNILPEQSENTSTTLRYHNGRHISIREYPLFTPAQYADDHLTNVTTTLESGRPCVTEPGPSPSPSYVQQMKIKGQPPRILIFLHGGLNTQAGSVERAAQLCSKIVESDFYPIFLNWQSAFTPSYLNHLFHIRQGEDWREGPFSRLGGYLTSPFALATDLSQAIVSSPAVTFFQIRNDLETVPEFRSALTFWSSDLAAAQKATFTALCPAGSPFSPSEAFKEYAALIGKQGYNCALHGISPAHELAGLNLSLGLDQRQKGEKYWAFFKYFGTLPFKLVTAPVIDAGGSSAWHMMRRSVTQLFHYDNEPSTHNNLAYTQPDEENYKSTGALTLFFEKLQKTICKNSQHTEPCDNPEGWEITLVAHSTGAIIAHYIVREFGALPIKNIVYMGAASSIQDYQDTVLPYLEEKNKNHLTAPCAISAGTQEPTCVYHLMLHEAAESGEWYLDAFDPFPRGSLLVWLDNFLSHPLGKEDRTLGRFTNFITTVHHTPRELRQFIHIHKFGVGDEVDEPKKHGDFSQKFKFWDSQCWGKWPDRNDCYSEEGHY